MAKLNRLLFIVTLTLSLLLSACEGNSYPEEEIDFQEAEKRLKDVSHWFYFLDVNLDENTIQNIEDSSYDLVVIDFITSEKNNTDSPLEEIIERWHSAEHPKLVIAYIDIGQAESFRTYWQVDWEIGNPAWILGNDPDGWVENYPVAFWDDEYREIWLANEGAMDALIDAGFDGIYLDWIEAYDDKAVIAAAEADGLDARQEMIWWVSDLADYGRERNQNFIVIAQNAAELATHADYVDAIDAIAQEQTWFDGGADNDPPGDCPLPENDSDIESKAYESSLTEACYDQYLEFPDSTLHVSSAWYIDNLLLAQSKGLTIFTIDYAVEEDNIEWVYETSRSYGFIPFVSNRWLNEFKAPVP